MMEENCLIFPYSKISDGKTGKAKDRASKVFLKPFGLKLSDSFEILPKETLASISKEDFKKIKKMAEAAKLAEENFNKAIKVCRVSSFFDWFKFVEWDFGHLISMIKFCIFI